MAGDGLQVRIAEQRLKGSHGAVETCSAPEVIARYLGLGVTFTSVT